MTRLQIEEISIEVEWKRIKNLYLRVYPPDGRVHISAPIRMDGNAILMFAKSRLEWIRKQQARIKGRKALVPKEFVTGERHPFMGKDYPLNLLERESKPEVIPDGDFLIMYVRPGALIEKRRAVMDDFYRNQLKQMLPSLIARWEQVMKVKVSDFGIKKMKTRWGTCNRKTRHIWVNLELAKKPLECLEYIVVHEMVHLLERGHNSVFYGYMDRFLPDWRRCSNLLK
ncbi:MAG: M48 family metallopeptidase [Clostridiaceae bacterium]|nr:M48 family metallopeptidase [Clostridiaceae bacterium]